MSSDKPREAVLQDTEKQSMGHGTGERQRQAEPMSESGQTRSFGEVGSISGLPESGHGTCIGPVQRAVVVGMSGDVTPA
jgi:hypothetical protein